MKSKTFDQMERMKDKAAQFVRDVLGDDDRAQEIEDESVESYSDRKRIEIVDNPQRKNAPMATQTKAELVQVLDNAGEKIAELLNPILTREQLVEGLQELDEMINGEEEEEEEEEDEDESEESEDDE
jgi:hypothetical protein